jgi:transcriptional regulator with XRE-family HTH domain
MTGYNKFDIWDLTPGEVLRIARHRAGLTQREAASRAGVGKTAWWEAEKGFAPALTPREARLRDVRRPSLPELLDLARRRSGLGLEGVAGLLGTSRVTLLALERAGDEGLRAFWEKRGFRFPM